MLEQWTPVVCDCGTIIAEVSEDRRRLRYLCGDRRHGGRKVYSIIHLHGPVSESGRIIPVLHEKSTEEST